MNHQGALRKMQVALTAAGLAEYWLPVGEALLPLEGWLGKPLSLLYLGEIFCLHCGRRTLKSFNQGYCFPCFRRLACCDLCIVKPELCHYDQGTCREPEWARLNCFEPHVVYLANSSALKVGITRKSQIPTRWIDQGATQAIPILETSSRHLAGGIEARLKGKVSDKTQWQKMLKGENKLLDLAAERACLLAQAWEEIEKTAERFGPKALRVLDSGEMRIRYPVLKYPAKVQALDLEKQAQVGGVLLGIKGQYLIFDCGVLNVRKFAGYRVELRG